MSTFKLHLELPWFPSSRETPVTAAATTRQQQSSSSSSSMVVQRKLSPQLSTRPASSSHTVVVTPLSLSKENLPLLLPRAGRGDDVHGLVVRQATAECRNLQPKVQNRERCSKEAKALKPKTVYVCIRMYILRGE